MLTVSVTVSVKTQDQDWQNSESHHDFLLSYILLENSRVLPISEINFVEFQDFQGDGKARFNRNWTCHD